MIGSRRALLSSVPVANDAVTYDHTAFVSATGDDGTGALNDLSHPYATATAALTALEAQYPGEAVTVRLLSDLAENVVPSDAVLLSGVTVRSHDTNIWTITGDFSLGGSPDAILSLSRVIVTIAKNGHGGVAVESAGVITGDANTTITLLTISATSGADAGLTGSNGTGGTGSPDYTGQPAPAPNSPPENGQSGGDFDATAPNDAGAGAVGNGAWNVTLRGSMTVTSLVGVGGKAGTGGHGGDGGVANGGAGQSGGNSNNPTDPEDGGVGGTGGNAVSNGGHGADGGPGGNGSQVYAEAGVTITASTLDGGAGGDAGPGGNPGTATGGLAGSGGSPAVNGGSVGPGGFSGGGSTNAGASGNTGSPGGAGSISPI